jgi:hypothetical protein
MPSAIVPDFMRTLAEPDWGWAWPRAQHLAQNDNGSALQPPSPALEPEGLLFRSEFAGSQSLDDTGAMFFCGDQSPVSGFLAMRGQYTPGEQQESNFPSPLTGLYPMSEFEWQEPTLEQPFESTDITISNDALSYANAGRA